MDSNSGRYRCTYSSCAFTLEWSFNFARHELNYLHRKKQRPHTRGKSRVTLRSNYGSLLTELEAEPKEVVYREIVLFTTSAKPLTIAEQDNGGVLESISSFVTMFGDILLRILKQCKQRIALEQDDSLTDTSIEFSSVKRYIKSMADSKEVFMKGSKRKGERQQTTWLLIEEKKIQETHLWNATGE